MQTPITGGQGPRRRQLSNYLHLSRFSPNKFAMILFKLQTRLLEFNGTSPNLARDLSVMLTMCSADPEFR